MHVSAPRTFHEGDAVTQLSSGASGVVYESVSHLSTLVRVRMLSSTPFDSVSTATATDVLVNGVSVGAPLRVLESTSLRVRVLSGAFDSTNAIEVHGAPSRHIGVPITSPRHVTLSLPRPIGGQGLTKGWHVVQDGVVGSSC